MTMVLKEVHDIREKCLNTMFEIRSKIIVLCLMLNGDIFARFLNSVCSTIVAKEDRPPKDKIAKNGHSRH